MSKRLVLCLFASSCLWASSLVFAQEVSDDACASEAALSPCLSPKFSAEYYAKQSELYFRTMESTVSPFVQPHYSDKVIRWEWPPWLLLTGYTRFNLIWTDVLLKLFPTAYDKLDCRGFDTQPFGRCHVVFNYGGKLCPIYEEFTFNDQGEITFIEAWSDYEGLLPMDLDDQWAEQAHAKEVNSLARLSTRVPGLGNTTGLIDHRSENWDRAVKDDEVLKDLRARLESPYVKYFEALSEHGEDVLAGCDPPQKVEK